MHVSPSDRFIRNHLKVRHLILLVELGRHATIANAAQAARLTQPSASRLLAELEHALGMPLLERTARGVAPTFAGKALIRRAGVALAEMEAAHGEISSLISGLGGEVAIGSVLSPAASILTGAITLFKQRCARVNVMVDFSTSKEMVERLLDGKLDIVLGRILDTASVPRLNFEPISDEVHHVIVRPGHPLVGRGGHHAGRTGGAFVDRAAGRQHPARPPDGAVPVRGTGSAGRDGGNPGGAAGRVLLTRTDMTVALPTELVQTYLDAGSLVALPYNLGLRMDVYGIITRHNHVLSPGAEMMLDALREAAATELSALRRQTKTAQG